MKVISVRIVFSPHLQQDWCTQHSWEPWELFSRVLGLLLYLRHETAIWWTWYDSTPPLWVGRHLLQWSLEWGILFPSGGQLNTNLRQFVELWVDWAGWGWVWSWEAHSTHTQTHMFHSQSTIFEHLSLKVWIHKIPWKWRLWVLACSPPYMVGKVLYHSLYSPI